MTAGPNLDVLVVDDERSVRDGLSAALRQAGYAPRAAESLATARDALGAHGRDASSSTSGCGTGAVSIFSPSCGLRAPPCR
jgi:CheY-like chemotaxis protein